MISRAAFYGALWAVLAGGILHAAAVYRVAGVVIHSETGAPLPQANVAIQVESGAVIGRQVTGADGRFAFDLPQGSYRLIAGTRNAMETYGLRAAETGFGSAIITGPGLDTSQVVFRWRPPAAISGKVLDEAGDPVEGALVQLVAARTNSGRRATATAGWGRTDDRGEYRFGGIPAGTYYLAVTAEPWYAGRVLFGKADATASSAFGPVYYPNVTEPGRAAPIVVKSGEEMRADFALKAVPGAVVTISLESAVLPSGMVSLVQEGIAGTDGFQRQERMGGQIHDFRGVPPGRYLVRITGTNDKGPALAQQWIDVNGTDVAAKLTLHPAPSISGVVEWKAPPGKPAGTVLLTMFAEEHGYNRPTVSVRSDGTFTVSGLYTGRYRPGLHAGSTYYPIEIRVEGAEARNGAVDLTEDETVVIRISANGEAGSVNGFVVRGEQALEGMIVVLAPVKDTANWLAYLGYQTESDGSFDFKKVPAGEYFLFAVDDVYVEYTNPEAIRGYFANARRVRVAPGGNVTERIEPLPRIER